MDSVVSFRETLVTDLISYISKERTLTMEGLKDLFKGKVYDS